MTRPRGGYVGFNRVPDAAAVNSAAVGVWTLQEAESLKRAGTWPTVPEQGSPPATPTGLDQTACDTETGTGTIAWNSVAGATSYVLEWSFTQGGPFTEAFSGAGTSTSLDVEGFGGAAYYRVKAVNADGSSAWSAEVFETCAIG